MTLYAAVNGQLKQVTPSGGSAANPSAANPTVLSGTAASTTITLKRADVPTGAAEELVYLVLTYHFGAT